MSHCVLCNVPAKSPEALLKCNDCKRSYHYQCVGFKEDVSKNLSNESRAAWKCNICLYKVVATSAVEEMAPIQEEDFNTTINKIQEQIAIMQLSRVSLAINNLELTRQTLEFSSLENRVTELETSLERCWFQMRGCEQYLRRHQLEISGVEQEKRENLIEIVIQIGHMMDIRVRTRDIDAVYRLPERRENEAPTIIVEFNGRKKRDLMLDERSKFHLTFKGKTIVINENLSTYYRKLFYASKQKAMEKHYKYCWIKNRKVFFRKTDHGENLIVLNFDDLDNIA